VSKSAEFDAFARNYEEALSEGLSLTGEKPAFYAERRVLVTSRIINQRGASTEKVLDFGCGIGTSIPFLAAAFLPKELYGVDVSEEILAEARTRVNLANVIFQSVERTRRAGVIDLVYCNGVFHHIEPDQRADALKFIFDSLRSEGYFALWENNPLNPGTRLVMAKCLFDRHAIPIAPGSARKMLMAAGFRIETVLSRFFFPRSFAFLRPLEPWLSQSMLGGQYLVVARKA
jgi:SAM-dependent methyltransferase